MIQNNITKYTVVFAVFYGIIGAIISYFIKLDLAAPLGLLIGVFTSILMFRYLNQTVSALDFSTPPIPKLMFSYFVRMIVYSAIMVIGFLFEIYSGYTAIIGIFAVKFGLVLANFKVGDRVE